MGNVLMLEALSLCFLRCSTSQSESARHITSQPGYGRSPANLTRIGHSVVCAGGRLHVQAARWLVSMSAWSRTSLSLQSKHTICFAPPRCLRISSSVKLLPCNIVAHAAHSINSERHVGALLCVRIQTPDSPASASQHLFLPRCSPSATVAPLQTPTSEAGLSCMEDFGMRESPTSDDSVCVAASVVSTTLSGVAACGKRLPLLGMTDAV